MDAGQQQRPGGAGGATVGRSKAKGGRSSAARAWTIVFKPPLTRNMPLSVTFKYRGQEQRGGELHLPGGSR